MTTIADIHVHSGYSMATSADMRPHGLWRWAQLKGIGLIGTGDFTHPKYFEELRDCLEPAEGGLFRLRDGHRKGEVPDSCKASVRFVLSAEISCIYSKAGRTRKVHTIVLAPGFDEAARFNAMLAKIGNIASDGRPILGLDARRLLEMALEVSPMMECIPAHAWTPHFSVFGAVSGFDSLEECYGDLTPHIHAIETGLSSDPSMNRRLSALDRITLISNSDAHSPMKLGREATLLDMPMFYDGLINCLRTGDGVKGTIEFFPEEGKYHVDGHRKCGVSMLPEQTRKAGYRCPKCGGKLTVGVMHRVDALADRAEPAPSNFVSIVPLQEIVSQVLGKGINTKGVVSRYMDMLGALGNEFHILIDSPLAEIEAAGGEDIAAAIGRMRKGDVSMMPGFDGQFGVISVTGEIAAAPVVHEMDAKGEGMLF